MRLFGPPTTALKNSIRVRLSLGKIGTVADNALKNSVQIRLSMGKIGAVADNVPIRPPYHCAQKQCSGKIEHG